jgi:radical SAM protein with 4Fe4S-binding SPASM domain
LSDWRTILERIRPHAHSVKLTGGEPTLYPGLEGVIGLLGEYEMEYSLFSNARWAYPEHVIQLLRSSSSFRGLLVSLHGATARGHEAFTGGARGSFDETCSNVHRATSAGLPVTLSTVIHRHNLGELDAMPELCVRLGADHVSFNRYLGPPVPDIEPSPGELSGAVTQIEAMRERGARVKFGNCIPQCFIQSSATGCLAGVAYCTVGPDGSVRPCNHSATLCGNLLQQPIEEIWHDAAMQEWRDRIPSGCHACAAFSQCHGGCRAQAEMLDLPADPLMRAPLEREHAPGRVELYEDWRPLRACKMREETFGYVLLRGNHVVPLAATDLPILDACDGQTTLRSLSERFGQRGLYVIYKLYQGGVIDMQD